jgi:hypothetical protein
MSYESAEYGTPIMSVRNVTAQLYYESASKIIVSL